MSNKTPRNARAKTKSALRLLVVFGLFTILLFVIWVFTKPGSVQKKSGSSAANCLKIEQECFELEVSDTDVERSKGLSDRDNLPDTQGMLFVFDRSEEQCFWMKDMRFNLDIIWLDSQKRIVKIEENIPPATYPDSFCANNTKYVLEFNQGFAAKYGLKVGTTLQF